MNHEELLKKIDLRIIESEEEEYRHGYGDSQLGYTIRAVVELHKSEWVLPTLTLPYEKPEPIAICKHCSFEADIRKIYPCPTIQAIEKELNG